MELSWLTKMKIGIVLGIGGILLGVLAWPLIAPLDPLHPVRLADTRGFAWIALPVLAFVAGFTAYFVGWPYGREVGILAVPAGLGLCGLRGGTMTSLMQTTPTLAGRQALYGALRWEPVFWLILLGTGYLGVRTGARLKPAHTPAIPQIHYETRYKSYTNGVLATVLSILITMVLIGAFAQNTPLVQASVATQPRDSQLAFALCVAFGGAAFLSRHFLKMSFIWTLAAMVPLYGLGTWIYSHNALMSRITERFPATSYPHALMTILPVQLVAFGTFGAVIGYWLAIRFQYWRRHECG